MNEATAMARLQRGDRRGLEGLVRRYQAPAVRLAYLIIRDRALAEETACAAFVQAYGQIDQLAVPAGFGVWFLGRVAAAAHATAARWEGDLAAEGTGAPADLDPGALVGTAATRAAAWAALGALPPTPRAAVALRFYPALEPGSATATPPGPTPPAPPSLVPATLLTLTLQEYAARAVSGDVDLWPAIWECVRVLPPPPRRRRQMPVGGLAWRVARWLALLPVMGLALLVGVALLGGRLVGSDHPAGAALLNGPQARMGGYTVLVAPAVADANRIVISYTVTAPPDQAFTGAIDNPHLIDAQGVAYPRSTIPGLPELVLAAGATSAPDTLVFDSAGLPAAPVLLHLTLSLRLRETPATPESGMSVLRAPRGPFSFQLQIPLDPARRALAAPQTVTAVGVTLTLDRLVVTPSETRLTLRYRPPNRDGLLAPAWQPVMELQAGTLAVLLGSGGGYFRDAQTYEHRLNWPLLEQPGPWTLTVLELQREDSPATRLRGPWIFRFSPPPLP